MHFGKLLVSFVGVSGFLFPLSPSAIVVLVVYLGLWLSESVATFWGGGGGEFVAAEVVEVAGGAF